MAGDTEDLVLSISADVRQMQRALSKLTGDTAKATATIQQQFDAAGAKTGASFDQTAARANRAFTVIEGGAKRMGNAIKASSVQTGNLAAQINDIGVQLAGGTSPFLIALQQGSQINQVLGGGGARGAVTALAGAFTSLINPVSLATIGIIALGGAAVQYFTSMISDGDKSAETLKREADLIRQVAKEWGDSVPAIKAYADEQERIEKSRALSEAGDLTIGNIAEPARKSIVELAASLNDVVNVLQVLGEDTSQIVELQDAFANLEAKVKTNQQTAADTERVQKALLAVMEYGTPVVTTFSDRFNDLAGTLIKVGEEARKAAGEIDTLTGRGDIPFSEFGGGRGSDPRNIEKDPYWRSRYFPDPEMPDRPAKAASKGPSEAEREAKAVADLIEQLRFEQELVGATNLEREQANALRRAGTAATAEQQEEIKNLIAATYAEKDAIKAQEDAYKTLQEVGKTAINGLMTALSDGKLEAQELLSILAQVAQQLLAMPGFGGGGGLGGLISGLLGSVFHQGGVVGQGGSKRLVHPAVFAGAPRMHSGGVAGLRSGEVPAILQKGEVVIPKNVAGRGAQPQAVTITLVGEEGELFTPRVTQISGKTAGVVVNQSRPQLSRDAVSSVQAASRSRPGLFRNR